MIGLPDQLAGGRYRIERQLGHGGMATVVLAHDEQLGRPVAIKVLADNLAADEDIRRRFLREARIAGRLMHPNIIRVYDAGEEVRPFFVMEYVAGRSLAEEVRDGGPLAWEDVVDLGVQVCSGLEHAHAAGVVHRDIKPQNLLRRSDGVVKVTDFGIAQTVEGTALTASGAVIGTLPYLAPERFRDGYTVTGAADVYAVGVVLYELLTGRTPYPSESISDLVEAQAKKSVLPLSEDRSDVPKPVERAIRRCLKEDPAARPRSAGALARELADAAPSALTHEPPRDTGVRATDVTTVLPAPGGSAREGAKRGLRRGRRRRGLRAALGALGIIVGAGAIAIGVLLWTGSLDDGEGRPSAERIPPPAGVPRAEEASGQIEGYIRYIEERTRKPGGN